MNSKIKKESSNDNSLTIANTSKPRIVNCALKCIKHENGDIKCDCAECKGQFFIKGDPETSEAIVSAAETGFDSSSDETEIDSDYAQEEFKNSDEQKEASRPKCDQCGKLLSNPQNLKRHKLIHTGEKPYFCKKCGAKFAYQYLLTRHQLTHTGVKPYSCKECGSRFASLESQLDHHRRIHTEDKKPFMCEKCHLRFGDRKAWRRHQAIHTETWPFVCTECDSRFKRRDALKSHQRTHSGEKPYECEQCCVKFSELDSLIKHRRTHTGERPYSCDVCELKFATKSTLVKHERTHTGERPFQCVGCGAQFARKCILKQHLRAKHPKEGLK